MDFDILFKELTTALVSLFGEKWGDLEGASKKDIDRFLEDSKEKLKHWTTLLVNEDLDLEDFEWLVKSQKNLLTMLALRTAGIHNISLGHFRNKVIKTIIDVVKIAVL